MEVIEEIKKCNKEQLTNIIIGVFDSLEEANKEIKCLKNVIETMNKQTTDLKNELQIANDKIKYLED